MTEQERKETACKLYDLLQGLMLDLYARWLEESKYENVEDYSLPIKPFVVAAGGEFLKMNKRPFGFSYRLGDATYQVMVRQSNYSYRRVS